MKLVLVDDWHAVVKQQKLVSLPAKTNINHIFENFKQAKSLSSLEHKSVIEGIKDHFNTVLSKQLLYECEQQQYANIISERPELSLTEIYGAVHLLRLFTKLGVMLSYVEMDEKCQRFILNFIQDFLQYLILNKSTLFTTDNYISA